MNGEVHTSQSSGSRLSADPFVYQLHSFCIFELSFLTITARDFLQDKTKAGILKNKIEVSEDSQYRSLLAVSKPR